MFLESQKDIGQQKQYHNDNVNLRVLKPKLISSLNYQQQYLIRRKQKRNNRRKSNRFSETTGSQFFQKTSQHNQPLQQATQIQNNFYKEVYDGNDKICGYWVNGLLEGDAQIQYNNGDYFKGRFQKGYKVQGLMIFKDQGSYQGGFYNQQFHGKGVLRLKEKTISAQWINGLVQSNCVVQYKNNNVYYGPLKDFKKHGYGYLYFPNDTKFFGQFVDGNVKGYGQFYQKGKLKCKGIWKNGKLVQQKKQQDWSYNFEQQNINWQLIQQLFEKRQDNKLLNCFQMLNLNTKAFQKGQQSQKFQQRLKKIKSQNSNINTNKDSLQQNSNISDTSIIDISKIKLK